MSLEVVEPSLAAVDALGPIDAVCALVTEDERPLQGGVGFIDWRLCGALSRVLKGGFFTGAPGEKLLLPTDGRVSAPRAFAVGVGQATSITVLGLEHALTTAATMLTKAQVPSVALGLPLMPRLDELAVGAVFKRAFVPNYSGKLIVFGSKSLKAQLLA